MSFSDQQLRRLKGKLEAKRVKTREHQGRELSYVEGWYVMAEANRIFGFEGWDRLSQTQQLLYERTRAEGTEVAYLARIRIIVRAGAMPVVREGTGFGSACAADPGDAHELAIKAAETDATKRALATFGNRFGLALYDKTRAGVGKSGPMGPEKISGAAEAQIASQTVPDAPDAADPDDIGRSMQTALVFLKALRERLRRAASLTELDDILKRTATERERLRDAHPDLRDRHGTHLVDVSQSIAALRRDELERGIRRAAHGAKVPQLRPPMDKSALAIGTTKRLRNKDHLKQVAGEPCLVCGRKPAHAHHLRFAQNRGLGLKVSDEFTVPLCAIDHDQLHRSGDERTWWQDRGIDPLPVAEQLWSRSMGRPLLKEPDGAPTAAPTID